MASRVKGFALIACAAMALLLSGCGQESAAQAKEADKKKADEKAAPKAGKPEVSDAAEAAKLIPDIQWVEAYPELSFAAPVALVTAPGDDEYLYVVEKFGKIKRFKRDEKTKEATTFLDVSDSMLPRSSLHNEEGLLSLVFHPDFAKNRHFFIYHTVGEVTRTARRDSVTRRSRISRFTVNDKDANKVDMKSEKIILEFDQPYGNHNGSTLLFGKDGFLYISIGDGGAGGDPLNAGQDLTTVLAKILRINIDKQDTGKEYSVPKDNPFVKTKDAKPEIWAYGLRNVWRMSFDRKTGDLWAGDVGQNLWEEIDIITKGGNYGWRVKEGLHDFKAKEAVKDASYLEPVVDHDRKDAVSITGGYVYRGKAHPSLDGIYFYGDYGTRKLWGLLWVDGKLKAHRQLTSPKIAIASFGEDQDGEIYAIDYSSSAKLLRLEAKALDKKD